LNKRNAFSFLRKERHFRRELSIGRLDLSLETPIFNLQNTLIWWSREILQFNVARFLKCWFIASIRRRLSQNGILSISEPASLWESSARNDGITGNQVRPIFALSRIIEQTQGVEWFIEEGIIIWRNILGFKGIGRLIIDIKDVQHI